ncbi:MlaD family protein [Yoonia sp.]|uniref:MlaD family protein n=1 Tax=Yoonia sp. TaxID=2212373 RepID=UPI0019ECDD85|nr:MlaD family protein [Yoonia sp.]MBE0412984.1 MCE family protein [Yoonia sp.]
METRAHFVLVGLFTILGILGGLGFFIWLASVQIDRQYMRYGILFEDVTGLNQSADVFFNGVNVGRVVSIRISENDPRLVYVGVEVDAKTPINVDTVAQVDSQGVTGVAYITLTGGAPGAPLLTSAPDEPALIRSRPSSLQRLMKSAPDIISDAADVMTQLRNLTGPDNQDYVRTILHNVVGATAAFEAALTDFSEITTTIGVATAQITIFTERLAEIGVAAQSTLETADETLATINRTFEEADAAIAALNPAIRNAGDAFATVDRFFQDDLAPLSGALQETLDTADKALASMDAAFGNADQIMTTDLGPVLADTRAALAELAQATASVTDAIPGIVTDVRATVAEIRSAVSSASPGFRDFGQLGGEARAVIRSINALVRQVSRDPAGFLLQDRVPDYRR